MQKNQFLEHIEILVQPPMEERVNIPLKEEPVLCRDGQTDDQTDSYLVWVK